MCIKLPQKHVFFERLESVGLEVADLKRHLELDSKSTDTESADTKSADAESADTDLADDTKSADFWSKL